LLVGPGNRQVHIHRLPDNAPPTLLVQHPISTHKCLTQCRPAGMRDVCPESVCPRPVHVQQCGIAAGVITDERRLPGALHFCTRASLAHNTASAVARASARPSAASSTRIMHASRGWRARPAAHSLVAAGAVGGCWLTSFTLLQETPRNWPLQGWHWRIMHASCGWGVSSSLCGPSAHLDLALVGVVVLVQGEGAVAAADHGDLPVLREVVHPPHRGGRLHLLRHAGKPLRSHTAAGYGRDPALCTASYRLQAVPAQWATGRWVVA
jgi:hypothetical protein